ncbi:class I SAM-dependent methyltransferase [Streptacidiphilus sp. PB12-B1b]|uniref:class I SAM-dependent methyltransferase n=1 Tax=Streptacidiphilus sp. PB12-B1b TaxID=2705012 RepID=UPI0015FE5728|nr:class I SAM-dependent methyltransferase [Streptacidiphilus sp. PB12-B1b]QMU77591.1 class I SAM-dependent methyltransferase [Streptacidiphilus sp. PB12-B1b]
MDPRTLDAYERDAADYADDWHAQPVDGELREAVRRHFRSGPTADIGCGAGRDTAWLTGAGFAATGYDASPALLAEARRRHPGIPFEHAVLPQLAGLVDGSFQNVLCETVIMHLPPEELAPALRRLTSVLVPGGTLYLTWRVSPGDGGRDGHGRLYTGVDAGTVRAGLGPHSVLADEEVTSASSGRTIHRLIVRTAGPSSPPSP